jgi:PTS system galactitol-specific IIA component
VNKITSNPEKHYLAVSLSGETDKDVLKQMASALYEEGYVKDTYSDAVIKREEIYPTGLPVGEISVAIPHTDPEHVNDAAICLGILDKPVTFNVMGMEGETVDVRLLFMLSILHKEDQMDTLQKLITVCQNQEQMKELLTCDVDKINEVMTALMES